MRAVEIYEPSSDWPSMSVIDRSKLHTRNVFETFLPFISSRKLVLLFFFLYFKC